MKRILLTNDDGIHSPGILELYRRIKTLGEVTVVAPDAERSAQGHAITLSVPLRVNETSHEGKFFGYAISGTPADCVKIAMMSIMKKHKPDLIISGVNRGPNLGVNVLYSGTVSGATEGAILGVPSFAVSLNSFKWARYEAAVDFARKLAKMMLEKKLPVNTLLNVNVPALPASRIKGVKITRQGMSTFYRESYDRREDPNKRVYYWLCSHKAEVAGDGMVDAVAVRDGYISITPLHYDMTDYKDLEILSDAGKKLFK
ncbi:MAG: 5'/3'-nucleotidase SurE [Candidatus Omnitrophota bacterium]